MVSLLPTVATLNPPYIVASAESNSPSLHLFAGTASGTIQVLTLTHAQGSWSVDPNILTLPPIDNLTNLTTLIVVDATTGEELTASPERLLAAMKGANANGVYWIVATGREVRCMDGVSVKRIGRAGFPVGVGVRVKEIGVMRHAGMLQGWPRRTGLMGHLLRFDRARGVLLRPVGDRVFDSESAAITAPPRGGRKWSFRVVRTHMFPSSTDIHTHAPICRLLPDPTLVSFSSTGYALVLSQPQGELALWRLFYGKRTLLPVLRFAPPIKEREPQGSGILGWISSLSGGGPGKGMSGEEVDTIRMCFLFYFVVGRRTDWVVLV